MNYELLQTAYNTANTTDEAFLTAYNGATVTVWKRPAMTDVLNYLLISNVWGKLDSASTNESYPEELRQKIRKFLVTVSSNIPDLAVHDAEPEENIATLLQLGIITQEDADGFLALAKTMTSQTIVDQGREVTQTDLNVMKLQDKITAATTQRDTLNQKLSVLDAALQQLWQGVDVELAE